MNKFTKLILTTAVFATSGFAATIAELQNGGEVKSGATIDFQGQTLTLAENASLDVYGDLTGTGTIKCGTGKVNVYGNAYKEDGTNKDAILTAAILTGLTVHTLDESNKGSIAETITVEPSSALIKTNADLASYAAGIDENHLVYVANSDGSDTKCVGKTDSALEIKASLANADASIPGLTPSALVVENKLKFSGDNSGFTGKTVTIGTTENPAEVEYASAKSAFQADTTVENGSKLTITPTEEVTLSKNLVINGSNKFSLNETKDQVLHEVSGGYLNVTGKLIIPSGVKLQLGTEYEASPIAENPSEYPKVMSWPVGSFSGELTKVYKNYYTVTFADGSSVNFYWDESSNEGRMYDLDAEMRKEDFIISKTESGELEIKTDVYRTVAKNSLSSLESRTEGDKTYYTVPLKYGQSVEIYEDPDNAGQYKTADNHYSLSVSGDNISVYSSNYLLKTLTPEEVASPSNQELIYAYDNTFSYSYDTENDSWVRDAQFMIFQPNAVSDEEVFAGDSRLIFDLSKTDYLGEITHIMLGVNQPNTSDINIYIAKLDGTNLNRLCTLSGSFKFRNIEGNGSSGFFACPIDLVHNVDFNGIFNAVSIYAKNHTFTETWENYGEYKTTHGYTGF